MLKHFKEKRLLVLCCFAALFVASCKDDNSEKEGSESTETAVSLDDFIYGLDDPVQSTAADGEEQIGDVLAEIDEEANTYCECTKYKMSESFSEVMLMDPTSDIIYPGSILEGNSIADGSYRQIVLDRAPLTISTDFPNITGDVKRTVENPSLSELTQTMKEMMYDSEIDGSTPAACSFEVKKIESQEQLQMAIGASVDFKKVNISEKFDFSKTSTTSKFLIKFQQVYYTVNVDAPSSPSKFFASTVTANDLRQAIGGDGSTVPVYVSSIKYGRAAYFCVESKLNADSVANVLNSSFEFAGNGAKASSNVEKLKKTSEYTISGTVIGGSSEDAVGAVQGAEQMISFITSGGNFSKSSPAKPVAFTLRRLSNYDVFSVVNGTEYVVRNCRSTNASIVPKYFYGIKGENDVCGTITVRLRYADGSETPWFYLFNQPISKNGAISVPVGKSIDAPSPGQNPTFSIDYTKYDGLKLIVEAKLYEWDDPCGCGNRHEYDEYDSYYAEFDMQEIEKNGGDVLLDYIALTKEFTEYHHWSGLFNNTKCHDPKTTATDCRVQFAFNVKFE